ncbi:thiamine pyrophosphate-binding protein [Microbacterium oryzae]|uniref:thiamine pyrophosphate-binding protein n=1 Tax=Microbacterium oryzae TaxID=743009 RepID=UPI0025B144C6|nr:thiamine pyrophosphate-binding protein [Microbacterium oryzae]MDN3311012.1 thiamine pyrophosphate-binding protein [Microbacterium oryzae]
MTASDVTVAELVGRTLGRLGVGRVFGVVGSGNFHVTNALRDAGVPFTAMRHEMAAATAADAFARMSSTVAAVSVHQGCGLTNATTGIAEAAKSRTPLLVLAAESGTGDVTNNFAMDQDGLARSVGAVAERIYSPETALRDVVRAFRTARDERRTVVLSLPIDIQARQVPAELLEAPLHADAPLPVAPDAAAVSALADLVEQSERPVILAGRGGRTAGPELRELGHEAGALLAVGAVAKGLFAGDPFDLGISGGFSSPLTAELLRNADLVIAFGSALNNWTTRRGTLIGPSAALVQVDVEPAALGAIRPITLGVLGDAAATARALTAELRARGTARRGYRTGYRTQDVAARIATESRWRDVPIDDLSTSTRIDPRVLTARLDDLLPRERIVSIDSGNFMGYPSQYLEVPDEFGFCMTQAFQSIGLGLSTAIGAALARPDRMPVLGTGDGGLLMAMSEFETACRLTLPLVVIVYNDAAYGAEVHHFGAKADLATVEFPDTDFAAIARGYGAAGVTVRTLDDLDAVAEWVASKPSAPLVIDAKIVSDGGSWWLQEAFAVH